LDVVIDPNDVI